MNITVQQERLEDAINTVTKFIDYRAHMQILRNVRMTARDNRLTLSVYNLTVGIYAEVFINASVKREGEALVHAKTVKDLVALLSSEKVTLKLQNNNRLAIACGNDKTTTKSEDTDEFPPEPSLEEEHRFTMTGVLFKRIVMTTALSAATNDSRPILCGLHMHEKNGYLKFAAADGYRLSIRETFIPATEGLGITIPAKAIMEFAKQIETDGDIQIVTDKKGDWVTLQQGSLIVSTQLIDGHFPDYEAISGNAQNNIKAVMKFRTNDMKKSLDRARVFARDNAMVVCLENVSSPDQSQEMMLSVTGKSAERGDIKDLIATLAETYDNIMFSANVDFLVDALDAVQTDDAIIDYKATSDPIVIRSTDPHGTIHVVMPISVTT